MRPTVSCIVPVYNGERYLAEALDSVLSQSLPPTEIIVIDDGSTDESSEVAARFAPHVRYFRQANAGPSSARNHGIRLAVGEYLSFLDADDLWLPDKQARQLEILESKRATGICISYLRNFWVEELAHERERLRDHDFAKPMPGLVCQCLLARRSVFETVGGFNESRRFGEDSDWYLRAEQAGIVREILKETLVYRRIHDQNLSYGIHQSQQARADAMDNAIENLRRRRSSSET